MAELEELKTKLARRFNNVPRVDDVLVEDWVVASMIEHGYRSDQNVPEEDTEFLLLFAQAVGVEQVALDTAFYFEYKDAEETVDKSMVSDQYNSLAQRLWDRYYRMKAERSARGPRFKVIPRIDR